LLVILQSYDVASYALQVQSDDKSFSAVSVRSCGKSPPSWRGIEQLGQHNESLYVFQCCIIQAVGTENFENVHSLTTFANVVSSDLLKELDVATVARGLGQWA